MAIVNLRGTNGSGKSTVARALLGGLETREIELSRNTATGKTATGYLISSRCMIVIGPYRVMAGGCDRIWTQDLICDSIRRAQTMTEHVFFEGLLVSGLYSRYLDLSREIGGMFWAFLDTPLEICLARISARNGDKVLKNGGTAVKAKYDSILRVRAKAIAAGERVVDINHERAIEQVEALFRVK